ncbi:MAG: SRPBCC family protein [Caulobacteraceae bacterium]
MKSLAMAMTVAVACAASGALAWVPDPQAQSTLAGGGAWVQVTAGADDTASIHAAIDIAAPPKTVWTVMNDCALASRLVTTMVVCKVVKSGPDHAWEIKEQVTKGNLFVPTIHNLVRNDYQPYSLIRFRKAGGDLRVEEGEWRLAPLAGGAGTRVLYTARLGANIVAPAALVRQGMRRDTAKALVNLRRESLAAAR